MANDEAPAPAENPELNRSFTKRRSVGRSVTILLCVAVLIGIAGIVISDSLPDAGSKPEATPTVSASAEPTPEASITPTPEETPRLRAAPRSDTGKTFTAPSVIGKSATQAATEILRLAPSARLQFVDQAGNSVEAQASYVVVATTPAAGEVTPTAGSVVVQVEKR